MRTILIALLMTLATQVQGHHELANRNLENGYSNYQEYCASCHGVNLEGQANWRSRNEDGTLPVEYSGYNSDFTRIQTIIGDLAKVAPMFTDDEE